jgi:ABC-2 type transport system permease protein
MTATSESRSGLAPAGRWLSWPTRRRLFGWLANPLAGKELLARMRGPRTFVIVTLELLPLAAIAAALYGIIAAAPTGESSSSAPVGKLFFAAVTAVELGLICLLAPALTSDLISGERERQTLDLLLVTPLSRRQIVVGKLVAALGSLLLLIVLALPIQAVAVLIGGIGVEELAVGLLILILTATTYGCVGLYWSARLKTTRAAMLLAYVTTLFGIDHAVALQPPALIQIEGALGQLIAASNPLVTGFTSAIGLTQGRPLVGVEQVLSVELVYVAPWLLFSIVHLLAALVLIWLTARTLRRART